jgi:hypothetical protein
MILFYFFLAYGFRLSIALQSADHYFNGVCSTENDDEAKNKLKNGSWGNQ